MILITDMKKKKHSCILMLVEKEVKKEQTLMTFSKLRD